MERSRIGYNPGPGLRTARQRPGAAAGRGHNPALTSAHTSRTSRGENFSRENSLLHSS